MQEMFQLSGVTDEMKTLCVLGIRLFDDLAYHMFIVYYNSSVI